MARVPLLDATIRRDLSDLVSQPRSTRASVTREVDVPDAVFDALRPHFDERAIVELTVLASA